MPEATLSPGPADEAALEAELASRIDPWLEHMRWRDDFKAWRERRLFQERYQQAHLASVKGCLGPAEGRRVLDLGAGMGGFAVALAREGGRVIALEFNAAYGPIIHLRGRRYGLDLPVTRGAGERLPFPAHSFDLVCAWDVLEHVQDPRALLQEARRVLEPDGAVLLTVVNRWAFQDPHYHLPLVNWLPRSWAERWIRRALRSKDQASFADRQALSELHYYSYRAFRRLAAEVGFRVEDVQENRLIEGTLVSPRPWRRRLRQLLRAVGLEKTVYRIARVLYLASYEVVLWKTA